MFAAIILLCKLWEKRQGVAAVDRIALRLRHGDAFVGLHRLCGHPRIGEWPVAAEYDPLGRGDRIETAERLGGRRERIVVPETTEPCVDLRGRHLFEPLVDHRRYRQPPR